MQPLSLAPALQLMSQALVLRHIIKVHMRFSESCPVVLCGSLVVHPLVAERWWVMVCGCAGRGTFTYEELSPQQVRQIAYEQQHKDHQLVLGSRTISSMSRARRASL